MDEEIKAKIRKYRRNIEISGKVIIAFGLWAVLKFVIQFALDREKLKTVLYIPDIDNALVMLISWGSTIFVLIFVFLLYYYIGRSAVRFAQGTKKGKAFLVIAFILSVLNIISIPNYFNTGRGTTQNLDTIIASIMVDLTTSFMVFDMIVSAIRLSIVTKNRLKES